VAEERDVATEERDRAAVRTEARLTEAQQLHDTVVQGLTVAKYALEGGNAEMAGQAIDDTLRRARAIITGLIDESHPSSPGSLRRIRPALDDPSGERGEGVDPPPR
jgi:signal transduction histidine kinase